eukprot:scaffold442606_cov19-Prasinocladus_malaysianus.AAC.2
MKPTSSDAKWDEKFEGLSKCFQACGPEDYAGITHNEESDDCYCWRGDEGEEWELEYSSDEVTYLLVGCDSDDDSDYSKDDKDNNNYDNYENEPITTASTTTGGKKTAGGSPPSVSPRH